MARTVGMILAEVATPEEDLVCPHCGRRYKSAAALRAHVKKEHPHSFDDTDAAEAPE